MSVFENLIASRLEKFVRSDPKMARIFYGIYSADTLGNSASRLMQRNTPIAFLIVNSRPVAVLRGGHWLAFVVLQERQLVLFLDSLGRSPGYYGGAIASFRSQYFPHFHLVSLAPRPLQSATSLLCGVYLLYWLKRLAHGADPAELLTPFRRPGVGGGTREHSRTENDRFIIRWARYHLLRVSQHDHSSPLHFDEDDNLSI